MAELQIKITVGNTDIFLQGDVEQVCKLFSDIRKNGLGCIVDFNEKNRENREIPNYVLPIEDNLSENQNFGSSTKTTKLKKKSSFSSPQLIKDLNLNDKSGKIKTLKEFLDEKKPKSNVQITTTFVYYLERILNIKDITIDHVYTCYRHAGYRIPANLMQNLTDTCSSRYGYLSRKASKFSLSVLGSNFVDFDLPKHE